MHSLIVKMRFGSHLYELDTPSSDMDYKGIFLPSKEDILLNKVPRQFSESTGDKDGKNQAGDVDYECFSLHEFIRLALNGETVALDMLHAKPEDIVGGLVCEYGQNPIGNIWRKLVENRQRFYCTDMKAYLGYVRRQAHKYGVKGSRLAAAKEVYNVMLSEGLDDKLGEMWPVLPENDYCQFIEECDNSGNKRNFYQVCGRKLQDTLPVEQALNVIKKIIDSYGHRAEKAETNEGIDWKAVSHALRAGYQLRSIYKHGDFEYPLEETDFLYNVKCGLLDFKTEVQPELEFLVDECEVLADNSNLPKKPDRKWWDQWLIDVLEETLF